MIEGTPFGRFRLESLVGRGGMGEVWRAYDTATDGVVALRLFSPHLLRDPMFRKRFRREAQIASKFTHPHVVPIHDIGDIDERMYVEMPFIEGRDLAAVIADGPVHPCLAAAIIRQAATALTAVHRAGFIYRNIKPSNVRITVDGEVYLVDFGMTQEAAVAHPLESVGVVAYMAPERFTGGPSDDRSDVYSLACVLYECLTGRRPYGGDSMKEQIAGHLLHPPPQPSQIRPGLPKSLDGVIAKGLAKDPGDRFQTAIDLGAAAQAATAAVSP